MTLEDSTTYQLILNRGIKQGETRGEARGEVRGEALGRTKEAQALVRLLGGQRFGPVSASVESAIRGITDRDRLERIAARLLKAESWDDLLATS